MTTMITVRPLASATEREFLFHLADQAFSPTPSAANAARWTLYQETRPDFQPEQLRGAFVGEEQVGGYILYQRTLRVGASRLPIGGLGAVVTHPSHRQRGVATALMQDAINYANTHKYALLLLDGIPNFYYRYGYTDIFDVEVHDIDRAAILAQPASSHSVRPATIEDAKSMLALYESNFSDYSGSFARSLAQQQHRLEYRQSDRPALVAVSPDGQVEGYLLLKPSELAADNWSALLALLQYSAQQPENEQNRMLRYQLPPDSSCLYSLITHLQVPDTSYWTDEHEAGAVCSISFHHRYMGWMARVGHLDTLLRSLLLEWQTRWRRSQVLWSGEIPLLIGDELRVLHIDGNQLRIVERPGQYEEPLRITPQQFVQLVFGYRPLSWLLQESNQQLASEQKLALNTLFPTGHTWIPSSDWF